MRQWRSQDSTVGGTDEGVWGTEVPQWSPGAKPRSPPEAEAILVNEHSILMFSGHVGLAYICFSLKKLGSFCLCDVIINIIFRQHGPERKVPTTKTTNYRNIKIKYMKQNSCHYKSNQMSGLLQTRSISVVCAGLYHGRSSARPERPKTRLEFNPQLWVWGSALSSPATQRFPI